MPSIGLVAIQSVRFPSAFLRMDGSNVTQSQGGGSGTVNCQFYQQGNVPVPNIGNDEVFELIPIPEVPNNGYAIRSVNYPSAFLRIDGSNVTQPQGSGSGTVNCQYYSSGSYPTVGNNYELLIIGGVIIPNFPLVYYIQSGPFPNAFLRIDGSSVNQFQGAGSGTVNCQYYDVNQNQTPGSPQDYELFYIVPLTSYSGPW